MRIKALLLDVTGTLLNFRHPVSQTYHRFAVETQLPVLPTQDLLGNAFKESFKATWQAYPCYGHHQGLSEEEWWKKSVKSTLEKCLRGDEMPSSPQFDRYFEQVYSYYGSAGCYIVYDDALALLRHAQASGLKMGVLTNSSERTVREVLGRVGLGEFFQFALSCQQTGYAKPEREAFRAALRHFEAQGIRREEVLHLGDNREEDYEGAQGAGLRALLLDRNHKHRGAAAAGERGGSIATLCEVIPLLSSSPS